MVGIDSQSYYIGWLLKMRNFGNRVFGGPCYNIKELASIVIYAAMSSMLCQTGHGKIDGRFEKVEEYQRIVRKEGVLGAGGWGDYKDGRYSFCDRL
jgi:hypothetical protein